METEGLDFGAALESLAERYSVTLERETEDPRDAASGERRERLYALLERTAAYYVRVLWEAPEAAFAREYLAKRGLTRGRAARLPRGLRAGRVRPRAARLPARGLQPRRSCWPPGLIQPSRGRAGHIDRFRGRVTFPLTDVKGHVLGFGARAMKPDQQPKYLNTSDGEIFHKSQVVYGQDMARAAAAKAGRVVIVEGYTDVIALHQAGVPEIVAQMGTALTERRSTRSPGSRPRRCSARTRTAPARRPSRAGSRRCARCEVRRVRRAASSSGSSGCRPSRTRRTSSSTPGATRCARCSRRRCRSSASRSSARSSSRTRAADEHAGRGGAG